MTRFESPSSSQIPGTARLALLAIVLLAGAPGCAGTASSASGSASGGASNEPATSAVDEEEARRQAALERLTLRQEAACEQVGDVLFTCAVEDARNNMSPEELAELDPDALEPRYKANFMSHCMASKMSLRQVKVYEGCLQDTTCTVFVPCLEAAQPQR